MQVNSFSPLPVNIVLPLCPAALAIFSSLTPLLSLPRIPLCLQALTQSRWLGKHVKNLSPVNATFAALSKFFSLSLKIHHKVIFAKYPINSIKVIFSPILWWQRKENDTKNVDSPCYWKNATPRWCAIWSQSENGLASFVSATAFQSWWRKCCSMLDHKLWLMVIIS